MKSKIIFVCLFILLRQECISQKEKDFKVRKHRIVLITVDGDTIPGRFYRLYDTMIVIKLSKAEREDREKKSALDSISYQSIRSIIAPGKSKVVKGMEYGAAVGTVLGSVLVATSVEEELDRLGAMVGLAAAGALTGVLVSPFLKSESDEIVINGDFNSFGELKEWLSTKNKDDP